MDILNFINACWPMRTASRGMGFNTFKTIFSSTRYVMEKNDVGVAEYVWWRLGGEVYAGYHAGR